MQLVRSPQFLCAFFLPHSWVVANFVGAVLRFEALPDGWNNLAIIAQVSHHIAFSLLVSHHHRMQALGFMDSATKYAALALIYSPVDNLAFLRSFASCHVNRFIQQSDTKDREIALVYLARALRQSPKLEKEIVEAYTALLMNGQDHRRCIQSLLAMAPLFETAPPNIQAMRVASLAICYRDAHEGDLAVEYFEKAVELAPTESSYHYELGGMFKRSEFSTLLDVNRALQHVQRALELAPNSAVVTYSLASIYAIARQLDQAIELYERAYRLDSTLEVALVEAYQLKQTVCNWRDRDALARRLISLTKKQLAKAVPVASSGLSAPHLTPWYGLSMRLPRGMQLALARRHAHVEAMRAVEFVSVALAAAQAEAKVNKEMFERQDRDDSGGSGDSAPSSAPSSRASIVASKGRGSASSSATSASSAARRRPLRPPRQTPATRL
jgi:tetratricopeptide (TPR) repeat protein